MHRNLLRPILFLLRKFSAERKSTTNESNNIEGELLRYFGSGTECVILLEEVATAASTNRQAKSKALETLSIGHSKRRLEAESDLNNEQERTSSSSSRPVSTNLRRRRRTEKVSHRRTFKRPRQSSSSSEEEEEHDHRSEVQENSEQQSESPDTGNLCGRRGSGKSKMKFIQRTIFLVRNIN